MKGAWGVYIIRIACEDYNKNKNKVSFKMIQKIISAFLFCTGSFMTLCLALHYSDSNAGAVTISVVVVGILVSSGLLMFNRSY